jgi:hypothetical protein
MFTGIQGVHVSVAHILPLPVNWSIITSQHSNCTYYLPMHNIPNFISNVQYYHFCYKLQYRNSKECHGSKLIFQITNRVKLIISDFAPKQGFGHLYNFFMAWKILNGPNTHEQINCFAIICLHGTNFHKYVTAMANKEGTLLWKSSGLTTDFNLHIMEILE